MFTKTQIVYPPTAHLLIRIFNWKPHRRKRAPKLGIAKMKIRVGEVVVTTMVTTSYIPAIVSEVRSNLTV